MNSRHVYLQLLLSNIASLTNSSQDSRRTTCGKGKQSREVEEKRSGDPYRKNERKGEGEEGVGTVARSAADYLS